MSRICQSCSLSYHSARPHLVSLIIDWAHLQSLTSTLHKLTHLCHSWTDLKVASFSTLVDVCLSARPSWISFLPEETQVYIQRYCTSGFQSLLRYLSFVGSPAWVILNKSPFVLHLPLCLHDQYRDRRSAPLKTRWSSPPTSSPLSGGISHSRSIPENSAGSLQGQRSTTQPFSIYSGSGPVTINPWISQTPRDCLGEKVSTGVWEVTGYESKPTHVCHRWPPPSSSLSPLVLSNSSSSPLVLPSSSSLVPPSSSLSPLVPSSSALPERPQVPLGLLIDNEGMVWSRAPEPAPRQRPPASAPRQRPPVPAPRQSPPVPAPRQRPPVPAPRQRPPVPAPRQRPPVPAPRQRLPVPAPCQRPPEPAPPECPPEGKFPKNFFLGGPYNLCLVGQAQSQGHGAPWPTWKNKGQVSCSAMASRVPGSAMDTGLPGPAIGPGTGTALEATCPVSKSLRPPGRPPPLPGVTITARVAPSGRGGVMSRICQSCSLSYHSARPHLVSLIIDWAHLQSLTSTLHKLTHLCHSWTDLKVASFSTLVDVCLSARPSWISFLPEETQVYIQRYCTSGFQSLLRYLSYVGSPSWVIVNKSPFDLHLPLCLHDQYRDKYIIWVKIIDFSLMPKKLAY